MEFLTWEFIKIFVSILITPLGIWYIKMLLEKVISKTDNGKNLVLIDNIHKQEKNVLQWLVTNRIRYNADRVWIAQFHNGDHYFPNNNPALRVSMTYEDVSRGIPTQSLLINGLPISLFTNVISLLDKNGVLKSEDLSDSVKENKTFYSILGERGVENCYAFAIRDLNGNFNGILGFDFYNRYSKISEENIKLISNDVLLLGGYLEEYNKNNKNNGK